MQKNSPGLGTVSVARGTPGIGAASGTDGESYISAKVVSVDHLGTRPNRLQSDPAQAPSTNRKRLRVAPRSKAFPTISGG